MTVRVVIGFIILTVATGACWALVTIGQAHAGSWISAVIGAARAGNDPALAETVFNGLIFGPLLAVALVASAIDRRNPLAPGRRPVAALGFGMVVGLAGLAVSIGDAWLAGTLADNGTAPAPAQLLLWGLGVVAFQVGAEEVYFRGWLQPALAQRWGPAAGVTAAALAFGALHIAGGARNPLSLLNLFLGGLMFGLFALRGGGLAAAFGAHFAWNAAEQLGWGLDPNPGLGSFGALADMELIGSPWWGGSGEGLNGSVGMTIALLAILAPLLLIRPRPAVPQPATVPVRRAPGRSGRAPA